MHSRFNTDRVEQLLVGVNNPVGVKRIFILKDKFLKGFGK